MDETTGDDINDIKSRVGRPRRPTAHKSVHQLVLNIQNEKKTQKTKEMELKIGQKVEAQDVQGDWYPAKIVMLEQERILVHFERWSARYDQWFPRDSPLVRERASEEKNPLNSSRNQFCLREEVLARWTDNRPYPATILELHERTALVLFFDGYRKTVKLANVEKMPNNFTGIRAPSLKSGFEVIADHNQFKCSNCSKGFRKQSLLAQHMKHYHKTTDDSRSHEDVTPIDTSEVTPIATPPVVVPKEEMPSVVSNRLKRKYVRKALPTVAVRKSSRQPSSGGDAPLTPKETVLTPNTTLPFWDARTVAEIHEADPEEVVNCVCSAREESGLMVQCESCLCWQHAMCMHFHAELDVPKDGYFCTSCRFPRGPRHTSRHAFLVNHALKSGRLPEFPFSRESNESLSESSSLLSSCLEIRDVIKSSFNGLNEIKESLETLEEKTKELEEKEEKVFSESFIKNEIFLMKNDLKNSKILLK